MTDDRVQVRRCRDAYTRIAGEWDRDAGAWDEAFHAACQKLFLEHLSGTRVLDAGCGLGRDSVAFAAAGLRVTAIDQVRDFAIAARTGNPRVHAAVMDLTALALRPGTFDGVFAAASLLHVPGPLTARVLASIRELLVPRGVLVLTHAASSFGLSSYTIEPLLVDGNAVEAWCHGEAEMTALLSSAGFTVVTITRLTPGRHPSPMARRHGLVPYQVMARSRPWNGISRGFSRA